MTNHFGFLCPFSAESRQQISSQIKPKPGCNAPLTWWCLGFCWVVSRWGNLFFDIAAGCHKVTWPTKSKIRLYPHGWYCWAAGSLVVPTVTSWMQCENIKEGNLGLVLWWIFFFKVLNDLSGLLFCLSTFLILRGTIEGRHYCIVTFFLSVSGNTHFSNVNANNPLLHS